VGDRKVYEKWILVIIIADIIKHLYVPGMSHPSNQRWELILLSYFMGEENTV